jgi:glycosyltransferase involved in cell wall biosynthesis
MKTNVDIVVSIVIPCLNEAGVVERLLHQLTDTPHEAVEVIAVDNGSSDTTLQILASFRSKGVIVVSDIPEGVSKARNAGARVARGEWIVFLDADTLLPPNFTVDLLAVLNHNAKFDLAVLAYKAKTNNIFFKILTTFAQAYQRVLFVLLRRPLTPGSVTVVRRSLHKKVKGYDESIRYNEDFEYAARVFQASPKFKSLRKPYVYFSTRRLERGGWKKVVSTYLRAEYARLRGEKYDPESYDMSDHSMK